VLKNKRFNFQAFLQLQAL